MESEAWDSMNRVRDLLTVAKCFAAKGVEKDDVPGWVAGTFATLIELIENEIAALASAMTLGSIGGTHDT